MAATVELAGSLARTASGSSVPTGGMTARSTLRVQLDVTAVSGTSPSLAVTLEDTVDGTNWNTIGTFAAKTAAGREVVNVTSPFTETVRARWDLTGTSPSFTFSVLAYAE